MDEYEKFKDVFDKRDLLRVVDAMAKRYNCLPTDILNGMTIFEFNLNVAIMLVGIAEENKDRESPAEDPSNETIGSSSKTWKSLGFKKTVVKKGKEEK